MRSIRVRFAVTILLGMTAMSCSTALSKSCTDMGCGTALVIRVPASKAFPVGAYHIELKTPEKTVAGDCSINADGSTRCEAASSFFISWDKSQPTSLSVDVWNDAPTTFTFTLSFGGKTLVTQSITATYTESRPNGPECGPICKNASVTTNEAAL